MNDRSTIVLGAALGGLIGAAAAYLIFTPRGRALRAEVEPVVRDLLAELNGSSDRQAASADSRV